jgi:hypothetical protein
MISSNLDGIFELANGRKSISKWAYVLEHMFFRSTLLVIWENVICARHSSPFGGRLGPRWPGDAERRDRVCCAQRLRLRNGYGGGLGTDATPVRATRYVKHLSRLTLGDTLGVHTITLPLQVSAFEAILALMAILVTSWCILDDCTHNYLLVPSFVFVYEMVKEGEVAWWFQPWVVSSYAGSGTVRPMR